MVSDDIEARFRSGLSQRAWSMCTMPETYLEPGREFMPGYSYPTNVVSWWFS